MTTIFHVSGGLIIAIGGFGPALGIGLIGMAFAEAIAIYALILAFGK